MRRLFLSFVLAAAVIAQSSGIWAEPIFVNGLVIPGNTLDATRQPGANGGRFGFFSDLYYDPIRDEWWALSDRGPGGGVLDYATRVQRFTLDVNPDDGPDRQLPGARRRSSSPTRRACCPPRRIPSSRTRGAQRPEPARSERRGRAPRPQLRSRRAGDRSAHRPLPRRGRIRPVGLRVQPHRQAPSRLRDAGESRPEGRAPRSTTSPTATAA